jgi:hypothetical protein
MADAELKFYVQDMSFSLPQRKKLRLEMTGRSGSSSGAGYLRARNQASNEVEFGIDLSNIGELGSYHPGSPVHKSQKSGSDTVNRACFVLTST